MMRAVARRFFALNSALLTLNFLVACAAKPPATQLVERSFVSIGSSLKVSIWTTDEGKAAAVADEVFREFARLDQLLSIWKDGSDVVRINKAAGIERVQVSPETIRVLEAAQEASHLTGGKFDITFAGLADIWKFDHDQDNTIPDQAAIDARLPLVNWQDLEVNPLTMTAFLKTRGMRIHLGGIGKGYAVERAVGIIRGTHGFRDFLVQSGGDMYAGGTNNGAPWMLGIADPRGTHAPFAAVPVLDMTFSTSGDYERSFMKDGVRYHHILDPDSGTPARRARSVTIMAMSPMFADVLSTGIFIMGEDGFRIIEELNNVEGIMITGDNRILISSGLKGHVQFKGAPTDAP